MTTRRRRKKGPRTLYFAVKPDRNDNHELYVGKPKLAPQACDQCGRTHLEWQPTRGSRLLLNSLCNDAAASLGLPTTKYGLYKLVVAVEPVQVDEA